ncbi:MAG: HAMP domain-containing histidine kinase, partial [Bacteroidota bacterium]|nr:HAMP domain-containing histidine kinase [Bacteroidota bacterium]
MTTMMDRQLRHLVRLVNDLLDISRISTGKIHLLKQVEDLSDIVRESIEAISPFYKESDRQIQLYLPREKTTIVADRTRLVQVVSNLLNNACKFSGPDDHVEMAVATEGEHVLLRVKDKGIGIAADQRSQVFEMFTQCTNPLRSMHTGLGIGLAISRKLVELHNGSIEVQSEGLGRGSEFIVRLPLAETDG